jgi:hypothetical protein
MAAPTNVRVEAIASTVAVLYWTYSGSAATLQIFRSTNGTDYSLLIGVGSSEVSYEDETVEVDTKYWYKISDDEGSTFSSVVTVKTYPCPPKVNSNDIILPRFNEQSEEERIRLLNEMADRIEQVVGDRVISPGECFVCPEDGRVVIDCGSGCEKFLVIGDQDINSFAILNCNSEAGFEPIIEVAIPANTTRKICGFPRGFGFGGDECFSSPVKTGSGGGTASVGTQGGRANPGRTGTRPGYGGGIGSGGGTGSGCNCVPTTNNGLTIKSCNANNSLNCQGSKSLKLIACGGKPPYTWSNTGDVQLSKTSGSTTTVTPPTNSGSAEAGVAYTKVVQASKDSNSIDGDCTDGGSQSNILVYQDFGCDDAAESSAQTATNTGGDDTGCGHSFEGSAPCKDGDCNVAGNSSGAACPGSNMVGASSNAAAVVSLSGAPACDRRSAGMIAAGCKPCGVQSGSTVTVEDALGTQTTIVLRT